MPRACSLVCPNCNSSDLKRVLLIHAACVYESRGRILGFFGGSGDGLLFGRYKGTSQSRLSKGVNPPRKLPYVAPIILWLVGLFPTMASVARAKPFPLTGLISVAYVLDSLSCLSACSAVLQLVGSSKETQELGTQVHVSTARGAHRSAHSNAGQSTTAAFTRATRRLK
jgi:hypothetical protein